MERKIRKIRICLYSFYKNIKSAIDNFFIKLIHIYMWSMCAPLKVTFKYSW